MDQICEPKGMDTFSSCRKFVQNTKFINTGIRDTLKWELDPIPSI